VLIANIVPLIRDISEMVHDRMQVTVIDTWEVAYVLSIGTKLEQHNDHYCELFCTKFSSFEGQLRQSG